MKPVPIHEAKTNLSRLVARACAGEEIIIAKGKRPLVKLVPIGRAIPERKFGAFKGKVSIDEAFFEPLPESELDAWED
jgi:prevent-host-death family protein